MVSTNMVGGGFVLLIQATERWRKAGFQPVTSKCLGHWTTSDTDGGYNLIAMGLAIIVHFLNPISCIQLYHGIKEPLFLLVLFPVLFSS